MFNNDLFSDVMFVAQNAAQGECESKQVTPAYKFVLPICSPEFEAMFYGGSNVMLVLTVSVVFGKEIHGTFTD